MQARECSALSRDRPQIQYRRPHQCLRRNWLYFLCFSALQAGWSRKALPREERRLAVRRARAKHRPDRLMVRLRRARRPPRPRQPETLGSRRPAARRSRQREAHRLHRPADRARPILERRALRILTRVRTRIIQLREPRPRDRLRTQACRPMALPTQALQTPDRIPVRRTQVPILGQRTPEAPPPALAGNKENCIFPTRRALLKGPDFFVRNHLVLNR
jgi:hypothetical protein